MGLSNGRPETNSIANRVWAIVDAMPFGVEEYLDFDVPGSGAAGDWSR